MQGSLLTHRFTQGNGGGSFRNTNLNHAGAITYLPPQRIIFFRRVLCGNRTNAQPCEKGMPYQLVAPEYFLLPVGAVVEANSQSALRVFRSLRRAGTQAATRIFIGILAQPASVVAKGATSRMHDPVDGNLLPKRR